MPTVFAVTDNPRVFRQTKCDIGLERKMSPFQNNLGLWNER